jgi:hypothetical protein
LVICTEIENHDIFRDLLSELFESVRNPERVIDKSKNSICNRRLAFSDMLAHLAYLKTVPCPSFNTKLNITFYNKVLTINEKEFEKIPCKNSIAIETLFEILDVRSILYMWKAMLFDYSLILISTQTSLQFYVAEALK